jgi:hypothetical protein
MNIVCHTILLSRPLTSFPHTSATATWFCAMQQPCAGIWVLVLVVVLVLVLVRVMVQEQVLLGLLQEPVRVL